MLTARRLLHRLPIPSKPPLKPHSKMPASEYARSTFGRPEASNLRHAADISSALAHPDAFITAATASATSSSGKSEAIFTASGLYPTPGAIDNFPSRMLEQMQTAAALNALGHSDVAGCTAPLIAGSSGIARFSRPFNQHSALVLPFRQLVFWRPTERSGCSHQYVTRRGPSSGICNNRPKIGLRRIGTDKE